MERDAHQFKIWTLQPSEAIALQRRLRRRIRTLSSLRRPLLPACAALLPHLPPYASVRPHPSAVPLDVSASAPSSPLLRAVLLARQPLLHRDETQPRADPLRSIEPPGSSRLLRFAPPARNFAA